jgi:hypothetical protein
MATIMMPLFVECSRCGGEVSRHHALVLWVPESGEGWAYCRDCADVFYETVERKLQRGSSADHRCCECEREVSPRDVAVVTIDEERRGGEITCRECADTPDMPW